MHRPLTTFTCSSSAVHVVFRMLHYLYSKAPLSDKHEQGPLPDRNPIKLVDDRDDDEERDEDRANDEEDSRPKLVPGVMLVLSRISAEAILHFAEEVKYHIIISPDVDVKSHATVESYHLNPVQIDKNIAREGSRYLNSVLSGRM